MASKERAEANRRNAKLSTGPRSVEGKQIASRNSKRHGLSCSVDQDPVWWTEVQRLGKIFVPNDAPPDRERAIKTALAAMVDVMRVQAAQMDIWKLAFPEQVQGY